MGSSGDIVKVKHCHVEGTKDTLPEFGHMPTQLDILT